MKYNNIRCIILYLALTLFFTYTSNVVREICIKSTLYENPFLSFVFSFNSGSAFSHFENQYLVLAILGVIFLLSILVFVFIYSKNKENKLVIFFLSLLSAGILTNTLERFYFQNVIDYINLNFISFPVFNLSDVFIFISVFALILIYLVDLWKAKLKK